MALTPSSMPGLGIKAPYFKLPDTISDEQLSLSELKSDKATVIMFVCNHCPFVRHIIRQLIKVANEYIPKGISFIAISSNDPQANAEDSPEVMKETAAKLHYPFPYLYDETQEVAKGYDATCTPAFFVYDKNLSLVYRGQFDNSRPSNKIPVTGEDLRKALDALLRNEPVSSDQKPSIGCNIKWKS